VATIRKFWCVVNPEPLSSLEDILWESTPCDLCLWARGGGDDRGLRLYERKEEARRDARRRIRVGTIAS
jgi:hypothetical protein